MGVSQNGWSITENPITMDLGVPLFSETSICPRKNHQFGAASRDQNQDIAQPSLALGQWRVDSPDPRRQANGPIKSGSCFSIYPPILSINLWVHLLNGLVLTMIEYQSIYPSILRGQSGS